MDVHQAGAAGPARAGLHDAELLRDHDPPPPAVVQRAVAGGAGAAAVRGGSCHRTGRADARRRRLSRLVGFAGPVDRSCCCGRSSAWSCWRRSAGRPTRMRIGPCRSPGHPTPALPPMTELRNVEADLSRFRARVLVASIVVLVAFLLLASRLVYLQVVRHEDLTEQAENNRTAIVPVVPNRGLILDRNGIVLATNYSAYTLEITPARLAASLDRHHRRAVAGDRDPAARPAALQEAAGGVQELRLAADPHPPDRRGSGPLRGPALPLSGRGHQGPAVPQLPLGRAGEPRDRLHRPHQPGRESRDGGLGATSEQANYRGTEYIGKLGVEQSYEKPAARHDRRRAGGDFGRRPRGAQAGQQSGDARQHGDAVDRHQAAEAGRGHVRRAPRRAGGAGPQDRRGAGLREQAHVRSQSVRRGHRQRELAGAERIDRQAAAQSRAARHLSAGLDLQAVHGAGGAGDRQAHAAAGDPRSRLLQVRRPSLPRRQGRRPRQRRHVQVDRASCDTYYYIAGQRPGRGRDPRRR